MPTCQVCNSTQFRTFFKNETWHWVNCERCEFLLLDPLPSTEDARTFQGEDIGEAYIQQMTAKLQSKMRRSRHRVRTIKRRVKSGKFLDVGSNVGCMVEAARQAGFDAHGVEINPRLVDYARQLYPSANFWRGTLTEANFSPESFDVAYTSEVIEHVPDTNAFLGDIARVLKPGGLLYLTTPEARSWTKGPQEQWKNLGAPDHIVYFNRKNIRQMLEKHGFTKVSMLFSFKPGIKLIARKS